MTVSPVRQSWMDGQNPCYVGAVVLLKRLLRLNTLKEYVMLRVINKTKVYSKGMFYF